MRDIYLIDFENVASEGLSGITYLSEDDQVIIFYSNNSNRLSMKMHILIGKSVCQLDYFEVTVGGKNALDHQISTWLGYLIGTEAAQRNYYIVSRDMGYRHVANFWTADKTSHRIRCVDSIKASRLERNRREAVAVPAQEIALEAVQTETILTPELPCEAAETIRENIIELSTVTEENAPINAPGEAIETPVESTLSMVVPAVEASEETVAAPVEPVERLPEKADARKNYRSRTRVRRTRTRGTENTSVETKLSDETEQNQEVPQKSEKRQYRSREKTAEGKQTITPEQLSLLIAPYPKLQEGVLRELIANNKRQVLCNTLRKHLGQEKGLALYNEIKKAAWH